MFLFAILKLEFFFSTELVERDRKDQNDLESTNVEASLWGT